MGQYGRGKIAVSLFAAKGCDDVLLRLDFFLMARFGDRIETTEALIREFADALRAIAGQFDQQAEMLVTLGITQVETTNWASAKDGADKIASFAGALQKPSSMKS